MKNMSYNLNSRSKFYIIYFDECYITCSSNEFFKFKKKFMKKLKSAKRRCHKKTSYMSNYAFFTLLHE